ncbi:sigma-70 family RNA polymerase sigma factor [Candidatus Collierbacteria bacterium]|nr:sigma-70 family RNA polymerase sigma factor [Candidatus Collierbacteria bacterium]
MPETTRLFHHQSFEVIYRLLALPVLKFIVKRMGGDQAAAEEVFVRTISAAWEGWHNFRHKSSYFTWICRIALNKIADYYRDQVNDNSRWVLPVLENIASADAGNLDPYERASLAELRSAMRECLELLPDEKRKLLQFRFWREMSIREIATLTGSTERAVEGKIYRTKQILKKILRAKHAEICETFVR